MTYGEELDNLKRNLDKQLEQGWTDLRDGDLMKASVHFSEASSILTNVQTLLRDVSKTALSRVMKERAGSR